MARDISIAISAKDNFSQAITTMRNANQSFNKDLTGLQTKLNELNKTKILIKADTTKAQTALKDAEKQFLKTGEAADKLRLEMANSNYENARRNLSLVSDNAKQAEKDIRSLTNAVSKSENHAGGKNSGSSIMGTLAASGAIALVGNTLSGTATTLIGSAYGEDAGIMASSEISSTSMGAAVGAALGSVIPGLGTAIGGAIGALGGAILGYVQGQTAIYEKKDDAFKQYYQDQYDSTLENQNNSLSSGSTIASSREQNKISFATLLGGTDNANEYLASMTDFANSTPFEYDDLVSISKTLLAYGYKQDELLPLLTKVGDTGSALGMGTDDMTNVATALGRMQTTGKTTLEYLNPLLERGIDVWSYLAEASGKTKEEVQDMVSKGLIPGSEAAAAIADYMGYDFAGNMDKQSHTYAGLTSTLADAQSQLSSAMGEGYNSARKGGLEEQIDWLSGESGQEMQDAYGKIGQWKASLENLSEQYQRDALSSIMDGSLAASYENSSQKQALERLMSEYQVAQNQYNEGSRWGNETAKQEASAEMGRILAEAQVIATNEYNTSEGAQILLDSNKTLADNIKNDSASQDAYWNAGYSMGQQFTKGLASAIDEGNNSSGSENSSIYEANSNAALAQGNYTLEDRMAYAKNLGYAYGLSYVPYDNYPANLHEGERVLTASENRNYGSKTPINITGNNFVVREEADIKKVAAEIANMIKQAYILMP